MASSAANDEPQPADSSSSPAVLSSSEGGARTGLSPAEAPPVTTTEAMAEVFEYELKQRPVPIKRVERYMKSATGVRVNTIEWDAGEGTPPLRGGILFCHGYGHYTGLMYDWLAAVLRPFGIAAFAIEHAGHGKSEGIKGVWG